MTSFGKKKFSDMLSLVKCEKVENLNSKIIKKKHIWVVKIMKVDSKMCN